MTPGNIRLLPGGHHAIREHRRTFVYSHPNTSAQYPKILREEVSIHVIQSREHILNTASLLSTAFIYESLNLYKVLGSHLQLCRGTFIVPSEGAAMTGFQEKFKRDGVNLITSAR